MIGFTIALALADLMAASPTPQSSAVSPLPSPTEAKRAVVACGLAQQSVSVQFEREMDEDIVWIDKILPLSTETLSCVARASLNTNYYVYFRDEEEQKRYYRLYDSLGREAEVAQATKWLREKNMLANLPRPKSSAPLSIYAEAVEEFCGIRKGTLLVARDEHSITFAEGGLGRVTAKGIEGGAATEAQFECMMKATSAADLRSQQIFFGFIGNEKRE